MPKSPSRILKNGSILMALMVLASVGTAASSFHLRLTASLPEDGSRITESPPAVMLEFSQRPALAVSRIGLAGPRGEIDMSAPRVGSDTLSLVADVPHELEPGSYTITWRTAGADGHVRRGDLSFTVAPAER
ncbi:MAG: copper resistance protein CopC [Gemmatimonadota bacterium]|nr:copper resistance protein CopC [Gemmatimonadota bacterium]